jgi:hypothetical protein
MNKVIELRIEDNKIVLLRDDQPIVNIDSDNQKIVKAEDLLSLFDYSYGDLVSIKPFDKEKYKESKLLAPAELFYGMLKDIVDKVPNLQLNDDNTKDIVKAN